MSDRPIHNVLSRLHGVEKRRNGYRALCPAHDDAPKPSLDVSETADGGVLVKCWGRDCGFEAIAKALGLKPSDFFPNGNRPCLTEEDAAVLLTNRGLRPETIRRFQLVANVEKQAWEFTLGKGRGKKYKRFVASNGDKYWVPRGTKLTVYHLSPCAGKPEAWLVEGEPDVWIMHQAGLAAFSFTGGAGNVPPKAVDEVARANIGVVHIVYDNDDEGREGARKVAGAFDAAGINCTIRELPASVGHKGDITTLYNNLACDDSAFGEAVAGLKEVSPQITTPTQVPQETSWPDPMDEAAYVGLAGEIIEDLKDHTEASTEAILGHLLVFFGNAVGQQPYYQVEADRHHLNENLLVVGPTSHGRKGVAKGYGLRLISTADPTWSVSTGLSSGEGVISHVRDPVTKYDPKKREDVLVDDGVKDKRLMVVETEFMSPIKVMSRDGNTLSPTLRAAWDDGNLSTLTKNSPLTATGAHISIIGHITAEELGRIDPVETANGFLNRFLIIAVRRHQMLPLGGDVSDNMLALAGETLSTVLQRARTINRMTFNQDAETLWRKRYPELSESRVGVVGALLSRAEAHVVRLSCVYALLCESSVIEQPHLEAALAFWDYCQRSVEYLFQGAGGSRKADRLYAELKNHPEGMTDKEIRDFFAGHEPGETMAELLVAAGKARRVQEKTGGRPRYRTFAL